MCQVRGVFRAVDAEGAEDAEVDFRVVHDAVEIFGAWAAGIQRNVIGRMAFVRDALRDVGRDELFRIAFVDAGGVGFGRILRRLMVLRLFGDGLCFLDGFSSQRALVPSAFAGSGSFHNRSDGSRTGRRV